MTICSTAFVPLGRMQATALGMGQLPIVAIEHPFGVRSREEVGQMARKCVDEVVKRMTEEMTR